MINFAVGPVMMDDETLDISARQIPYFRTNEFSAAVENCKRNLKLLFDASDDHRILFMTGSGTASMEAAVMNVLSSKDRAIVINGGTFGERFTEICSVHGIEFTEIKCEYGKSLTEDRLADIDGSKYTAFLVNLCETSTGVLYDINLISEYCKKYGLILIVDAVSAFLCDPFGMKENGIDVVITGSQKALALAPGLSVMCFSARAVERIVANDVKSLYFDLKDYLLNDERGQTPFTPAVGVILQLEEKTSRIIASGGIKTVLDKTREKALYFRKGISGLPLEIFADRPSAAVTALSVCSGVDAYDIFIALKERYGIFVCPNGGQLKSKVFRVGHMGKLSYGDYDRLLSALNDVLRR